MKDPEGAAPRSRSTLVRLLALLVLALGFFAVTDRLYLMSQRDRVALERDDAKGELEAARLQIEGLRAELERQRSDIEGQQSSVGAAVDLLARIDRASSLPILHDVVREGGSEIEAWLLCSEDEDSYLVGRGLPRIAPDQEFVLMRYRSGTGYEVLARFVTALQGRIVRHLSGSPSVCYTGAWLEVVEKGAPSGRVLLAFEAPIIAAPNGSGR